MEPTHLSARQNHVLDAIFKHPSAHNLDWKDVVSFLSHIGVVTERHNGEFDVSVGGKQTLLARPHGKDLGDEEIRRLRTFLESAGVTPAGEAGLQSTASAPAAPKLIVAIDHHSARIFDGASPPHVFAPYDPHGFLRHLEHRKEADYQGERVPEDHDFYNRIAAALAPAQKILIIGHATGKSDAGAYLLESLKKHHSELASRVVDSIKADLSHITDDEILMLASPYFS